MKNHQVSPWVRDTVDPATGMRSLSTERGNQRFSIANIVRSGVGARHDRGERRLVLRSGSSVTMSLACLRTT